MLSSDSWRKWGAGGWEWGPGVRDQSRNERFRIAQMGHTLCLGANLWVVGLLAMLSLWVPAAEGDTGVCVWGNVLGAL